MAKRVQRLGATTAIANAFIGLQREITVDTTLWELRVHDGVTPGGHRIITKELADSLYAPQGVTSFDFIEVDIINEFTPSTGVTVDGVLLKDGLVDGVDITTLANAFIAHASNTANPHIVTKAQLGLSSVIDVLQLQAAQNLNDLPDKALARVNLGVAIGVNVQASSSELTALAALDATPGYLTKTAANAYSRRTLTGTASQIAVSNGDGTAGNPTFSFVADAILPGTGGAQVPTGNTAQRNGADGSVRYNSQTFSFEFKHNGGWTALDFTTIANAVRLIATGVMAVPDTVLDLGVLLTYKHIQIRLSKVVVDTDARDLWMRFATNDVPAFDASAVYNEAGLSESAGGIVGMVFAAATKYQINGSDTLGNVAGEVASYTIDIIRPNDIDDFVQIKVVGFAHTSSGSRPEWVNTSGDYKVADNITFIRFLLSGTGNFTCKYDIYGYP